MEERVALPRERGEAQGEVRGERGEVRKPLLQRTIRPEEEILRVVESWNPDKGYLGRVCLKTREKVWLYFNLLKITVPFSYDQMYDFQLVKSLHSFSILLLQSLEFKLYWTFFYLIYSTCSACSTPKPALVALHCN